MCEFSGVSKPSLISRKLSHSNPVGWDIQRAMQMKFEDIYQFFRDPPPNYLNKELAVCYVLSVLLQGESYGTQLIQQLEQDYPTYRLSDTVLYSALKFLEDSGAISGVLEKGRRTRTPPQDVSNPPRVARSSPRTRQFLEKLHDARQQSYVAFATAGIGEILKSGAVGKEEIL
jgi:hypothetical protein